MKKKVKVMLEIGGFVVAPLCLGAIFGIPKIVEASQNTVEKCKEKYGDTYDYYLKTKNGRPVYLPIKNNTISIILDSFNDEARENARYAISKFDDVLKTQEVTIYDNGEMPNHKNYIRIKLEEDVATDENSIHDSVAQTVMHFDSFTGKMKYPIEISIERKYIDCYNYKEGFEDSPETSVFSSIVQHELGHTLGLCDRYDEESRYDTVMYYTDAGAAQDYTDLDYHNIRYIYDKEYDVEVNLPSKMQVTLFTQQNQMAEEPAKEM